MKHNNIVVAFGLFLTGSVYANPFPQDDAPPGIPPIFEIANRRRTHQCDDKGNEWMKKIEAQAWKDAGAIAEQAAKWNNKVNDPLQPLADYWMGKDSIKDDNAKTIKNVLKNEKKFHHPNRFWPEMVVEIFCGEHPIYNTQCRLRTNPRDPDGPKVTAYATARISYGTFYNSYIITLCPRFFKEKFSLEEIMKDMIDGKRDRYDADNHKKAWGFTLYHELTHLWPIIAKEQVGDVAYYACPAAKLAHQNGCSGPINWKPPSGYTNAVTLNNADSYAFFGTGALFKYRLGIGDIAKANDTCHIGDPKNNGEGLSVTGGDIIVEGQWFDPVDRDDGTYNYTNPPKLDSAHTPADDGAVELPSPYTSRPLPTNLARPYADAEAYFSSRTLTSEKKYPPTTVPDALTPYTLTHTETPSKKSVQPKSSSPPKPTTCFANQVDGNCVQEALPSQTPNGGPASPVCNKVNGKDYLMFNDDKAAQAAITYCQNLHDGKVVLDKDSSPPAPGFQADVAEKGGYVALTVLFDVDYCDPKTSKEDQKVDFGAMSAEECFQNLYFPIQQVCGKDPTWSDYNKDFSIEGGVWGGKCAVWSVSGLPGSPP